MGLFHHKPKAAPQKPVTKPTAAEANNTASANTMSGSDLTKMRSWGFSEGPNNDKDHHGAAFVEDVRNSVDGKQGAMGVAPEERVK